MNPEVKSQKAVWEQVAEYAALWPFGVGRSEVAQHFGVGYTTALRHLEKGVSRGLLVKSYTWVKQNSRGWVYTAPVGGFVGLTPGSILATLKGDHS